jgi:hypothetical protein
MALHQAAPPRGHQDRPEAQEAGLVDRFFGRKALRVFHLLSKINQHDAILLDDADQQNDPDDRDTLRSM